MDACPVGPGENSVEVTRQQTGGRVESLGRLIGGGIGLHVERGAIVLVIAAGEFRAPGVEVGEGLGEVGGVDIFDDFVVGVVFALLQFLFGRGLGDGHRGEE
jgi:hypothetical protein